MCTPIRKSLVLLAAVVGLTSTSFATQPSSDDPAGAGAVNTLARLPEHEPVGWRDRDTLTGDWNGARTRLEERGVSVGFSFWGDVFQNVRGGANTADMDFMHLESLVVTLDTEKLFGHKGGTFFVDLQHIGGDNPSDNVGDWQWVSSLAADRRDEIAELYYEQKLLDDKLRIKVGKIEPAYDFHVSEVGVHFLNASSGQSPTMPGYPTYPDPAFGMMIDFAPSEAFYVRGGVFDGAQQEGKTLGDDGPRTLFGPPADLFFIGELGVGWTARDLPGRAAFGVTYHTGTFDRFEGGTDDGVAGCYLVLEHRLTRESSDADDEEGFSAFFRAGLTDGATQEVRYHLGGGVVAVGLVDGRDDDVTGFAVNLVGFSNDADNFAGDEVNLEWFYRVQVTDYLTFTPDLQYIINPGGNSDLDDALALGLRFVLEF